MTGSLQEKHGKYYVVVRFKDDDGKSKTKWYPTGVSSKGNNKRKAQQRRLEILADLESNKDLVSCDKLFSEWLEEWIELKRVIVRQNTLESYQMYISKHIKPFFDKKKRTIESVTREDIEEYYRQKIADGLSPNSLPKHRVVISGALKEACIRKIIRSNPADDIALPRRQRFRGEAYSPADARHLLSVLEGEPIRPAVVLGLCYGLRRSEVCGLRWKDINFESGTLTIRNTVVKTKTVIEREDTKNEAGWRTMALVPETIPYLETLKKKHDAFSARLQNMQIDPLGHVCTHEDGRPFSPDYVTRAFTGLLRRKKLPHMRFHELRHTAGSLLLAQGLSAKQIQEYLGHKYISTTFDIYTHMNLEGKFESATAMGAILLSV